MSLDLNAYFDRVGFDAAANASVETLKALHWLHPQIIPFENLDPFLGRPARLELDVLQEKLVHSRRGGYCFEHNLLFMQVLQTLGFQVKGLAARVLWNKPEGAITPRSHMLLCVEAEGKTYLADVGFGGLTQTAPLLFEPGKIQRTPHERFRITLSGNDFCVEAEVNGAWRPLYRFDLSEQFEVDYGVTNYFLSTNPTSRFVTGLMAARALPDRRLALSNNRLTTYHADGETEQAVFETAEALADTLRESFGIAVPGFALFKAMAEEKGILC